MRGAVGEKKNNKKREREEENRKEKLTVGAPIYVVKTDVDARYPNELRDCNAVHANEGTDGARRRGSGDDDVVRLPRHQLPRALLQRARRADHIEKDLGAGRSQRC